ncbi:helix-turn-helix domain-containing protein [Haladaptatus sp. DFWS20]|uniref:helix-turn-helix domain-containing protein n=1 Tax=Haladaptatus sp. DFWS20 TaxID=3403467 RepID=UPI003EC1038A
MDNLTEISIEELQETLDEVEGKKATQRLIAAIAYKNGITQTELAEWYGVQRRTIYNWLQRFKSESLEQAVADNHRSGRPRKLDVDQHETVQKTLQSSPKKVGYAEEVWTPVLVRQYIKDTFSVDYSVSSCRRLMKETVL